jgi:hypothetical protein
VAPSQPVLFIGDGLPTISRDPDHYDTLSTSPLFWTLLPSFNQKGIITYGLAPNRQNPFAGAAHDAVFNTWRRVSSQVLYWLPSAIIGYYAMEWANGQYVYLHAFPIEMMPYSITILTGSPGTTTSTRRRAAPSLPTRSNYTSEDVGLELFRGRLVHV